MKCAIKDTLASATIQSTTVTIKPGYFNTKAFIKRFGEWRKDKLTEEAFTENILNIKRFNTDGSPKIYTNNSDDEIFYINKNNSKINIKKEYFGELPLELRSSISTKAIDSMVSSMILLDLNTDVAFQEGEKSTNFDLERAYDKQVVSFKKAGASDILMSSLDKNRIDFISAIKMRFRSLGIVYQSNAIKQAPSIQRNPVDKASALIKSMIEYLPKVNSDGSYATSEYLGNKVITMSKSYVWYKILDHMSDLSLSRDEDVGTQFVTHLKKLTAKEPWITELVETLEEGDADLRKAFVTATNNVKNVIFNTEYVPGVGFITKDAGESTTDTGYISRDWAFLLENKASDNKNFVEDFEVAVVDMDTKLSELKVSNNTDDIPSTLEEMQDIMIDLFDLIGVSVDESLITGAFNNFKAVTTKNFSKEAQESASDVNALKLFIKDTSSNLKNLLNVFNEDVDKPTLLAYNLNYFISSYKDATETTNAHMVTSGLNNIYIYSLPSILQEVINDWKSNPGSVDNLRKISGAKNSVFLKKLAKESVLQSLQVAIKGALRTEKNNNTLIAGNRDIKVGDYAKLDFFNVMNMEGESGLRKPIFNTQVPADKGKEFQFRGQLFTSFNNLEQAVEDVFVPYAMDEYDNMITAKQDIIDAVSKATNEVSEEIRDLLGPLNNDRSDILDKLSAAVKNSSTETLIGLREIIDKASKELTMVYHLSKRGSLMGIDPADTTEYGNFLGGAFKFITPSSLNDIDGLISPIGLPILEKSILLKEGKGISNKVQTAITLALKNKIKGYAYKAVNEFNIQGDMITGQLRASYNKKASGNESLADSYMYMDYVLNSIISKVEYAKLFTGPVQFYKNIDDYIKRVPATYADGLMMATDAMNKSFTQMTFATEAFKSPISSDTTLPMSVRKYYARVDRTDAQGYITVDRWADIMRGTGKFDKNAKRIFSKIKAQWEYVKKGEKIPAEANLTNAEVKSLSAQPLKGVFFNYKVGGTPVYLKYSSAVLIPSFINNNPKALQLSAYMNKHGIDEAIADTGVKVGALRPHLLFSEDGFIVDMDTKPPVRELENNSWRLQQDLPTKTLKDTKIGIQVQKVIMSALAFTSDNAMIRKIQNAVGDLSNEGLRTLLDKFGVTQESLTITDLEKFYSNVLNDMLQKEVPEDNVIYALKAQVAPSLIPHLKDKIIANIMASMKKSAVDIMTPGGAFIQVSDQLISRTQIGKGGITMLIDSLDQLKPPRIENGKLIPGQVLIPHKIIAKLLPNYKNMSPTQLREAITPEALQLIGYRIPTQAKASVDLLQIVGILPEEMGDSIITYGEITAKTGSDFDIDKMFIIAPELELQDSKVILVPEYREKTIKKQETFIEKKEVITKKTVQVKGIAGYSKPEVAMVTLSDTELVSKNDPIKARMEQEDLKKEYKDLEDLINCLWK